RTPLLQFFSLLLSLCLCAPEFRRADTGLRSAERSLSHAEATIHGQHGTVDVPRFLGGQESHRSGYLTRFGVTPGGDLTEYLFLSLCLDLLRHLGGHET